MPDAPCAQIKRTRETVVGFVNERHCVLFEAMGDCQVEEAVE